MVWRQLVHDFFRDKLSVPSSWTEIGTGRYFALEDV